MVIMRSKRKLLVKVANVTALVAGIAPQFEDSGIVPMVALLLKFPVVGRMLVVVVAGGGFVIDVGGWIPVVTIGLSATRGLPPNAECPLAKHGAICVPISRAKVRVAAT